MAKTAEQFLVKDYKRLRRKVLALQEELDDMRGDGYGAFDLRCKTEAIRVRVATVREFRLYAESLEADEAERLAAADDQELEEWAGTEFKDPDKIFGVIPITVEEHTFRYALNFVSAEDGEVVLVTDGVPGANLVKLSRGSDGAALDEWVTAGWESLMRAHARKRLREVLRIHADWRRGRDVESDT